MEKDKNMLLVETKTIADQFYFESNNFLGQGQFGKVYKGFDKKNGDAPVAIKVIDLQALPQQEIFIKILRNEIKSLEKLQEAKTHPNYPYILGPFAVKKTKNNIYIVTEYCEGGNLEDLLKAKGGRLTEAESIKIIKGIIKGFALLRDYNIIHRDMKPENVLLSKGSPKIADFGFSRFTEDTEGFMMATLLGSPLYMAPQILKRQTYTAKCDIFSIGVMFYQLIYGMFPWMASSPEELHNNIQLKPLIFPQKPLINDLTKDFIKKCLVYNESERIDWQDTFSHPLIKEKTLVKPIIHDPTNTDILKKSMVDSYNYSKGNEIITNSLDIRELRREREGGAYQNTTQHNTQNTQQNTRFFDHERKTTEVLYSIEEMSEESSNSQKLTKETQEDQIKKKIEFTKTINRIAYERNKIFFINIIISEKLHQNFPKLELTTYSEVFVKTLFVLTKYQLIRMIALKNILTTKTNIFRLIAWEDFTKSTEYEDFLNLLKNDLTIYEEFFRAVYSRAKEVAKTIDGFVQRNQDFLKILNEEVKDDPLFCYVFNSTLFEFISYSKQYILNQMDDRQLLIMAEYIMIAMKRLSDAFPLDPNNEYDFFQFYELREKGDQNVIHHSVLDKFQTLKI